MWSLRHLLASVCLAWAVLAAGPAAAREAGAPVRLVAPQAGARLAAGFELPDIHAETAEGASSLSPEASAPGPANGVAAIPPDCRRAACSWAGPGPVFASDILLLIQRQNE